MDAEESNKFINSLVKNLQVLCHGHVSFNSSIQVIGHLYLNVDSNTNIDYIVNEKVCKNDTSSTVFVSNSYHSEPHKKKQDNGISQKKKPSDELEASVDLTDDGTVVQRLLPINFRVNNSPSPIHPAYRDQGPTHHHSRKSRKPFHNIEAATSPVKVPRMSLTPIQKNLNRDNNMFMKPESTMNLDASHLNLVMESDYSNSNIPDNSLLEETNPSRNESPNNNNSAFDTSLQNIKCEPGEDTAEQNNSLFEQPVGSNSSQPTLHSDASADEEFFSGLRDKTLGVFPVALHTSDQVMGSDNYPSLSQPSTSNFKSEIDDMDQGSGARNLDSSLNVLPESKKSKDIKKCTYCGAVYYKRLSLYRHIKDKHLPTTFDCQICGRTFNRKFTAIRHQATHNKHQFKGDTRYIKAEVTLETQSSAFNSPLLPPWCDGSVG